MGMWAKCDGHLCEIRETCKRFRIPASDFNQPWISPKIRGPQCTEFLEWEARRTPNFKHRSRKGSRKTP